MDPFPTGALARAPSAAALTAALALWLMLGSATSHAFDVQGHRGARGLMPENTLAGFSHALSLGVTTLEMDLGITRDGHVVVSHDPRLNPSLTRGRDGNWIEAPGPVINSLSLEELEAYDVGRLLPGSRYAQRFPGQSPVDGERVPTLAQVLTLVGRSANAAARVNVEIKLSPFEPHLTPSPEAFAQAVVDELRRHGAGQRATIQSFDWRTLRHVQALAPEIRTAYLSAQQKWLDNIESRHAGASPWTAGMDVDDFGGSIPRLVEAAGGDIWSPYYRELDREQLEAAKALGLQVIVWTVNEAPDMHRMIDLGVDGIITDYPDRLREVARQRRLVP